jgi:hypothetical protein
MFFDSLVYDGFFGELFLIHIFIIYTSQDIFILLIFIYLSVFSWLGCKTVVKSFF